MVAPDYAEIGPSTMYSVHLSVDLIIIVYL